MMDIAYFLAYEANAILVSGGARGADSFFEEGCDRAGGNKEIWLPEAGFNGSKSKLIGASKDAYIVAERYVGHWKNCKAWARAAHARNCHQVLGADLLTPVSFVVCWTPGGERVGGTATAISIAEDKGIPILNLGSKDWSETEISDWLEIRLN
ncbi:hypothetical protein [Xanthomonas phage X1]|nr:hypothetical protein [Xanthomonas phage X1]